MAKRISRRGRFDFIGEFVQKANDSKGHYNINGKNNFVGQKLSFGIIDKDGNRVFPEIFGGLTAGETEIRVSEDNTFKPGKPNRIAIPVSKRNEPSIIAMVADFNKITVDLTEDEDVQKEIGNLTGKLYSLAMKKDATEEDKKKYAEYKKELLSIETRKEFIADVDAIEFLFKHIDSLEGKTVRVRGDISYNAYKGKITPVYSVQSFSLSNKEKKDHELSLTLYPVFDSESVDSSMLKENGRVYINGFGEAYSREIKANGLYPQMFAIDTNEFDITTKEGLANLKMFLSLFKVEDKEKDFLYQLGWEGKIVAKPREEEVVDPEEEIKEQLTDVQKQMLEIGVLSMDDIVPKRKAFGKFEREFLLTKPIITKDFKNGKLSTGLTLEEAEEVIIRPGKEVQADEIKEDEIEDVEKTEEKEVEVTASVEDVMSDIFG